MKKKRQYALENEEFSFWQSYSDMMAALLLLFVLIMCGFLLKYSKADQELKTARDKASAQYAELEEKEKKLNEIEKENKEQKEQLANTQKDLDKIIGIRQEIIENLSRELKKADLSVNVDPTNGSIAFDSSILFSVDTYQLTSEGTRFLDSFLPIYFSALLSGKYKSDISEIIIEGHTDTDGPYMYNLDLSQKRAFSVSQYCLEHTELFADFGIDADMIQTILTANGRSYSNPIRREDGSIDMDASRRVEFKFRLKDDEMISQMKGILEKNE